MSKVRNAECGMESDKQFQAGVFAALMESVKILFLLPKGIDMGNVVMIVGDWMGTIYSSGGRRWDLQLFLDHDSRYERTVRMEPDFERQDAGQWKYDEPTRTLRLVSNTPDASDSQSGGWSVLSVTGLEDTNVLLVLRENVFAGRNLPIILYRVHCNGRGYGTECENQQQDRGP
jgi:hypothetical protein